MEILEFLGLTSKEKNIYTTLNSFSSLSATELVKKTNIPSSKIYFMLDSLVTKGLVTHTIEKRHKVFSAEHPNKLKELLDVKKAEFKMQEVMLKSLVPDLVAQRDEHTGFLNIQIYEGVKGIKSYYEKILRISKKGELLQLGGSPKIDSLTLRSFFRYFHKKRSNKGLKFKIVKKAGTPKLVEEFPLTEVRYLNQEFPTSFSLFRDTVAIIIFNVQPTLIRIKNKELTNSFQTYFDNMWKNGKKEN